MHINLQPIVAFRQQPLVAFAVVKLQHMVVDAKKRERVAFGKRLSARLAELDIAPRKQINYIFESWPRSTRPTREAIRKWLRGVNIPDQANLAILAGILETVSATLTSPAMDEVDAHTNTADTPFAILKQIWETLEPPERKYVLDAAKFAVRGRAQKNIPTQPNRNTAANEPTATYRSGNLNKSKKQAR